MFQQGQRSIHPTLIQPVPHEYILIQGAVKLYTKYRTAFIVLILVFVLVSIIRLILRIHTSNCYDNNIYLIKTNFSKPVAVRSHPL